MPVCFQLLDKTTKKPVDFITVDNAICAHMGVEPHETDYFMHWYDSIGFSLAMGRTFEELKQRYTKRKNEITDPEGLQSCDLALKVIEFMDLQWEATSWSEHKGY